MSKKLFADENFSCTAFICYGLYIYIGIFTAIFLIQYFCWHGIFPFFKSYSVIENTWLVKTNIKRNCFVKLWKSTICATFCVKSTWRSVLHEVKSVLCEVKSTWRSEMKERSPMLTLDTFGHLWTPSKPMVNCFMYLNVQSLYCMAASSFRGLVTGPVFRF